MDHCIVRICCSRCAESRRKLTIDSFPENSGSHVYHKLLQFSREFINPIIHQITGNPPELIIRKSLEVLAKITVPVAGEPKNITNLTDQALSALVFSHQEPDRSMPSSCSIPESPMTNLDAAYALEILDVRRSQYKSRDRAVFTALIQLHSYNHQLLEGLSRVIQIMCSLQPPEFVFVSFAIELDAFISHALFRAKEKKEATGSQEFLSPDLVFVSSFIQQMSNVLLVTNETNGLRELLRDCIGKQSNSERDKRRVKLFHILLHSFAHNLMASTALCLWAGAYRSATYFLQNIHPLDIHLIFLLELDRLVELLERPLFRHLHLRMLEADDDPKAEGSGSMLFRILALLLMIVPQSTCYYVLRDRLMSLSRFRHCTLRKSLQITFSDEELEGHQSAWIYASHVTEVRQLHCDVAWDTIRSESLETFTISDEERNHDMGSQRRDWLGFANEEEEISSRIKANEQQQMEKFEMLELRKGADQYHDIEKIQSTTVKRYILPDSSPPSEKTEDAAIASENDEWKSFWKESVS
jgi:Vacuolar protein 14 C-terminal Fig4p binding